MTIGKGLSAALLLAAAASLSLRAEGCAGRWWTKGRDALVEISTDAAGHLAGKIVQGPRPEEKDAHNPRTELRQRPLLGLTILQGFTRTAPLEWKGGQVYDPDSGSTYKAILWLEPGDSRHLKLKGYVGIPLFGRTEEWTRETND